ncbi:MAG: IclR family transcriptional regulator [Actinomycetota bacterium]
MKKSSHPDFISALARGLDVIQAFKAGDGFLSLTEVATLSELPRPTARRVLFTLEELGFVRIQEGMFTLTPKVLDLGMAFVTSKSIWDITQPHLAELASGTGHSSSIALLAQVGGPKCLNRNKVSGLRHFSWKSSIGLA